MNPDLFNVSSVHANEEDQVRENMNRTPKTRAILFSFKTYPYPIKAEGLGPDLANAIEGLKSGNAPGMWCHKGSIRWGKSVCEYLRS
ncbi:hypothetical protein F4677DRAFT_437043 [Hypoxylon crocopeplum]|nr:hypothetical protein F4677DRAFT_437043 [Hypoxylon crocopeplum]